MRSFEDGVGASLAQTASVDSPPIDGTWCMCRVHGVVMQT